MIDEYENDEGVEFPVEQPVKKLEITDEDARNHESNSPLGISNSKRPMVRSY